MSIFINCMKQNLLQVSVIGLFLCLVISGVLTSIAMARSKKEIINVDMTNIDKLNETAEQAWKDNLEQMKMFYGPFPEQYDKTVIEEIERASLEYGVDYFAAFKIAECESRFDRYATNKVSGAKGVFQFLDSTWEFIKAPGHQYDFKENVRQFMIWYPLHPEWWDCN